MERRQELGIGLHVLHLQRGRHPFPAGHTVQVLAGVYAVGCTLLVEEGSVATMSIVSY
jgi:hypothetical protein